MHVRALLFALLLGYQTAPACTEPAPTPVAADVAADTAATDVAVEAAPSGPVEITTTSITVGSLTFDARQAGPADGELVLLLHGFPETSFEWRDQLVPLGEAGFHAVAPDQRGYSPGARPADVADYTIDLLVADVLGMADALGATTFHLVGHDWGAAVAWSVAAAAPERVSTLTALSIPHLDAFAAALADTSSCQYGASGYMDQFGIEGSEAIFLAGDAGLLRGMYGDLPQEAIDEYIRVLGTSDALGAALNWYRANVVDRTFTSPPIGPVSTDTLFIWSDGDSAVCPEPSQATADYVTGPYRFETIADVDHWVVEKAADTVTALLIDHLLAL